MKELILKIAAALAATTIYLGMWAMAVFLIASWAYQSWLIPNGIAIRLFIATVLFLSTKLIIEDYLENKRKS